MTGWQASSDCSKQTAATAAAAAIAVAVAVAAIAVAVAIAVAAAAAIAIAIAVTAAVIAVAAAAAATQFSWPGKEKHLLKSCCFQPSCKNASCSLHMEWAEMMIALYRINRIVCVYVNFKCISVSLSGHEDTGTDYVFVLGAYGTSACTAHTSPTQARKCHAFPLFYSAFAATRLSDLFALANTFRGWKRSCVLSWRENWVC